MDLGLRSETGPGLTAAFEKVFGNSKRVSGRAAIAAPILTVFDVINSFEHLLAHLGPLNLEPRPVVCADQVIMVDVTEFHAVVEVHPVPVPGETVGHAHFAESAFGDSREINGSHHFLVTFDWTGEVEGGCHSGSGRVGRGTLAGRRVGNDVSGTATPARLDKISAVSYTQLTLPTILLV